MNDRKLLITARATVALLATLAVIVYIAEWHSDRDDARYFGSAAFLVFVIYQALTWAGRRR